MEILLLQPVFLLLHLQNAFGIQIYAFMKGFPPRSGEDFHDGPDRDRFARLGEKKHAEGCSNIRRLLPWTCKDSQFRGLAIYFLTYLMKKRYGAKENNHCHAGRRGGIVKAIAPADICKGD
ncbi:MAG: hypothetical protein Q4E27_07025 [Bacteroidales bacterium]|nr:hypothetical protein [Bacteroidales bacterium]